MNLIKNVLAITLLLSCLQGYAQKKHALLIGINDYYEAKGVKSKDTLRGPVNDANAIRELLIKKFGYKSSEIDTIYNAAATRENIINGLRKKIAACKPGDIMFFYFSGHGVWMENKEMENDPVKQGMSQAMLTSDLYSYEDNFKCFIRDVTLKRYFNLFIDKKVVLTSVFDCCFSGKLSMGNNDPSSSDYIKEKSVDFNELMGHLVEKAPDLQAHLDSIAQVKFIEPSGCKRDSAGNVLDMTDTDADGVPDCADWEIHTPRERFPVDSKGIGMRIFEMDLQNTLNRYDSVELKAFQLKQSLSIAEKDNTVRPVDRKNSNYLFLAATTDAQKGLEFKATEFNKIHGMFTAALIRVLNTAPASISAAELFKKIEADMARFKKNQTPTMYADPNRLKSNLIGTKQ